MAYKIRWSRIALEDRISILSYMLEAGADTAAILRLDASIVSVAEQLKRFPELGRAFPGRPFRYVVHHVYMIVYTLTADNDIVILQIWDTRQDPTLIG
jgi:plasmid stabilization system protein ParE